MKSAGRSVTSLLVAVALAVGLTPTAAIEHVVAQNNW